MKRRISEMRNLGPVMERRLREIGVETERDLRELGSIAAWHRLRFLFGQEISLTALHAMKAGVAGSSASPSSAGTPAASSG
jgi:DNA transformation protein